MHLYNNIHIRQFNLKSTFFLRVYYLMNRTIFVDRTYSSERGSVVYTYSETIKFKSLWHPLISFNVD